MQGAPHVAFSRCRHTPFLVVSGHVASVLRLWRGLGVMLPRSSDYSGTCRKRVTTAGDTAGALLPQAWRM